MEEYSYKDDMKRVADRRVDKIREMVIYKAATREECLEAIVYEMAAKLALLQMTLDVIHEEEMCG